MSEEVLTVACSAGFRDGEVPVPDGEDWYRVCADSAWDDEKDAPSNLAFQCGSTDEGELSGARSSKTSPEETHRHQVEDQGKAVRAVLSIPVAGLSERELHLHDDSDLLSGPPATPEGHTWLDLKHLPTGKGNPAKKAREKVRGMLLDMSSVVHPPSI